MSRWKWVVLAALVSCGRATSDSGARVTGSGGTTSPGDATGSDASGKDGPDAGSSAAPCHGEFTVFLAATNPGEGQRLDLTIAGVDLVGSDGTIEPTFASSETFSFPSAGAFRVALAPIPAVGGFIDASIRLADILAVETGGDTHPDLCSGPLSFRFDAGKISPESCHVVLILDLAKSIAAGPSGPVFLPSFSIHY